jgi:cysteinyl-tRNA synthetase, unknown class
MSHPEDSWNGRGVSLAHGKQFPIILMLLLIFSSIGCLRENDEDGTGDENENGMGDPFPRANIPILGNEVDTFLYVLQNIDVDAIIASDYDLVIMDYSTDGTDEGAFTRNEIQSIRESGKIVVSYLSIGEAEEYRYYWEENWTVGDPEFIIEENPDWEGNYKVEYWSQGWQDIIISGNDSYLGRILNAGFGGVYLDIIDAYEFFEEEGREGAAREMVDFVGNLTNASRQIDPDFLVIPQNGEGLLVHQEYLTTISGQGKEDLYFDDDDRQSSEETSITSSLLENVTKTGKFVLITDYPTTSNNIVTFHTEAANDGFLAFSGNRELDRIPEIH